jgi:tetratricopeptide (TPR) repeat protein
MVGSRAMKKNSHAAPASWLEQAYPQMHYLVLALDGDRSAGGWLEANSHGVARFTHALAGEPHALASLQNGSAEELDDLFEVIDNDDLASWLAERRPELHLLFEAIKGDDHALTGLRNKRAAYARLVPTLREVHERFLSKTASPHELSEGGAAADMGCLIGEMHLRQGEYEKAIEAFSRAIETQPSPDLFLGRARAYRGLAERDESAATLVSQRLV